MLAAMLIVGMAVGATPLDAIQSLNDTSHSLVDLANVNEASFNQTGFENALGPLGGMNDSYTSGSNQADIDWQASIKEWGNTTE